MSAYTKKNLADVEDQAASGQMGPGFSARFARTDLDCQDTGFGLQAIEPNTRLGFAHKHDNAEEVYVVLRGGGRMLLDEAVIDIATHDAIRVAPEVTRSFESGDDGLQFLVFGAHHDKDGEIVQVEWPA